MVRRGTVAVAVVLAALVAAIVAPAASAATPQRGLSVTLDGEGLVRSTDGRIQCGSRCSRKYRSGAIVTLTAQPQQFFSFAGWSGGCVGTAPTCVVALDRSAAVSARFTRDAGLINVTVGGQGSVVGAEVGILCASAPEVLTECLKGAGQGLTVKLIAQPRAGAAFAAWGGACAAVLMNVCDVVVGPDTQVSATFRAAAPAAGDQLLTVFGNGAVVSSPPGISCPATCDAVFASGTVVTLTSSLVGWAGSCSGLSMACTLVMDGPHGVQTELAQQSPPFGGLGVNVSVSGPGRVEASGAIRCGGTTGRLLDCEHFFNRGDNVSLRAVAEKRGRFVGWSGFCPSRKKLTCRLKVTAPKSVVAVFGRRKR
jgi:hypothetical protein